MKLKNYIFVFVVILLALTACNEGIDPITAVSPGTDVKAPVVKMTYPSEGAAIQVKEDITSINITGEITDDIELKSVVLKLDGTQISSFNSFKDYRRFLLGFTYNNITNGNHKLDVIATDLSGKSTTQTINFVKKAPYKPLYSGEIFYMPFDGTYTELLSITDAAKVGSPTYADGKKGKAYAGAADSYITFPTAGMLNSEFSAIFWYNMNSTPDRSGILVIGSSIPEDRTKGFRLFREGSTATQNIKINVGTGSGESWIDMFKLSSGAGWKQIAISISAADCKIFLDGELVKTVAPCNIGWDSSCDKITIGAGGKTFSYWGHKSDLSLYDELRIFNKALTAAEVQTIYNAEK